MPFRRRKSAVRSSPAGQTIKHLRKGDIKDLEHRCSCVPGARNEGRKGGDAFCANSVQGRFVNFHTKDQIKIRKANARSGNKMRKKKLSWVILRGILFAS